MLRGSRQGKPSQEDATSAAHRRDHLLVANPGVADPAAVDRVLGADDLQIGWLAFDVGLEGPPQCGDDLRRLCYILGMVALRPGHGRHTDLGVIGNFMGVGIMARPPKARAIPREAAVVDVDGGHAEAVPPHRLKIAGYPLKAGQLGVGPVR